MLHLSDAFDKFKIKQLYLKHPGVLHQDLGKHDYDINVHVRMININHGHNKSLKDVCKPLFEYAWIVQAVRNNSDNNNQDEDSLVEAITQMIHDVPDAFVLKPFLLKIKKALPVGRAFKQ